MYRCIVSATSCCLIYVYIYIYMHIYVYREREGIFGRPSRDLGSFYREDLIICLVLYIGLALRLDVICGWVPVISITPQERRSARVCAVQTRFRLSQCWTFFVEMFFCSMRPSPFFKHPSLASSNFAKDTSRSLRPFLDCF